MVRRLVAAGVAMMCGCVCRGVGVFKVLNDGIVYVVTLKARSEAEANRKRVSGNNLKVSKKAQENATK